MAIEKHEAPTVMEVAEKQAITNTELVESVESGSTQSVLGFDEKATRKLIRKIDLYLIPFLALLYLSVTCSSPQQRVVPLIFLQPLLSRPYKYRQCSSRQPRERSRDERPTVQQRPCHILSLLRRSRDSVQSHDEEDSPFLLDPLHHGLVGPHLLPDGHRP